MLNRCLSRVASSSFRLQIMETLERGCDFNHSFKRFLEIIRENNRRREPVFVLLSLAESLVVLLPRRHRDIRPLLAIAKRLIEAMRNVYNCATCPLSLAFHWPTALRPPELDPARCTQCFTLHVCLYNTYNIYVYIYIYKSMHKHKY